MSALAVNLPHVVAEVEAAFHRYEQAFVVNDIAVLDELFWDTPQVVRYGSTENLYGIDEIRAFRVGRSPGGLQRTLSNTVITTFGTDFAVVSTEFRRASDNAHGRQSQTWVRLPASWRIAAAHVSLLGQR